MHSDKSRQHPTVRGDVVLLTAGRRGTDEDTLAVAGAVLLDAALDGVIDVTGRRVLGVDRRRVVPGAAAPSDTLVADIRRRVEIASAETPKGWCERVAVFGEDAVTAEVVDAGLARRLDVPWWKRLVRHRTLAVADDAIAAIRARLDDLAAGRSREPRDAALGLVLRETDMLSSLVGRRAARRIGRNADAACASFPRGAQAIAATLREHRRRADSIGTYYADD